MCWWKCYENVGKKHSKAHILMCSDVLPSRLLLLHHKKHQPVLDSFKFRHSRELGEAWGSEWMRSFPKTYKFWLNYPFIPDSRSIVRLWKGKGIYFGHPNYFHSNEKAHNWFNISCLKSLFLTITRNYLRRIRHIHTQTHAQTDNDRHLDNKREIFIE